MNIPAAESICFMCEEVAANPDQVSFGWHVADLPASRLLIAENQYVRGMCVLITRDHATEMHRLEPASAGQYMNDLLLAAAAVEKVYTPHKLNFEVLGNAIPHVHGFIKPRYLNDPIPDNRIPHDKPVVKLSPEEYKTQARFFNDTAPTEIYTNPQRITIGALDSRAYDAAL